MQHIESIGSDILQEYIQGTLIDSKRNMAIRVHQRVFLYRKWSDIGQEIRQKNIQRVEKIDELFDVLVAHADIECFDLLHRKTIGTECFYPRSITMYSLIPFNFSRDIYADRRQ
jgi:hypothetical protein